MGVGIEDFIISAAPPLKIPHQDLGKRGSPPYKSDNSGVTAEHFEWGYNKRRQSLFLQFLLAAGSVLQLAGQSHLSVGNTMIVYSPLQKSHFYNWTLDLSCVLWLARYFELAIGLISNPALVASI
jgi:hypothetical protein